MRKTVAMQYGGKKALTESGSSAGNVSITTKIETDESLSFVDGVLSVNTADAIETENDLPVTSAAVAEKTAALENRLDMLEKPEPGENGATFTPSVSDDGTLSWTNDKGLDNPAPVNVKGPAGPQGPLGEIGPTGPQGETGPAGPQGETGPAGPQGETGPAGPQGPQGNAGLSIFRCSLNSTIEPPAQVGVSYSTIENGDRELQVGDLLLMINGRIYKIVSLTPSINTASAVYTGTTLSGSGGTGGGADLLNEYGLIKQSVLPEGYPYFIPGGGFFPENTLSVPNEEYVISLEPGHEYTVTWNGVEYRTTAKSTVTANGSTYVWLGYSVALDSAPTGEPFIISTVNGKTTIDSVDFYLGDVTLSIATDDVLVPIDERYLPEGTGGITEEDAVAALIETDMLPSITDVNGTVLTDAVGNILLYY